MKQRKIKQLISRLSLAVTALVMIVSYLSVFQFGGTAGAAQITSRKLTISSSANGNITTDIAGNAQAAGSGGNGAKTNHKFDFTLATGGNVGSILFEYCTTPIPGTTCTAPTGMDASTITSVASQSFSTNDFTVDASTVLTGSPYNCSGSSPGRTNCIAIKRAAPSNETAVAKSVSFGTGGGTNWIKNPTSDNTTFFVRIVTYTDTAYTTQSDYGTVASSTAQQVDITAKVQEKLNFSVGTTVTSPGGTCTAFSDTGALSLGDVNGVLDSATAYDAHSYFRVSTNAVNGTAIYYSGDTLKSGSNSIASVGESAGGTSSSPGTAQFGLAIDSSDTQSGSGYSFTSLTAATSPNDYGSGAGTITSGGTAKFQHNTTSTTTPIKIASSSNIISCDTGSVRYLGNISTSTPAGIYTTTITYIAVPTY